MPILLTLPSKSTCNYGRPQCHTIPHILHWREFMCFCKAFHRPYDICEPWRVGCKVYPMMLYDVTGMHEVGITVRTYLDIQVYRSTPKEIPQKNPILASTCTSRYKGGWILCVLVHCTSQLAPHQTTQEEAQEDKSVWIGRGSTDCPKHREDTSQWYMEHTLCYHFATLGQSSNRSTRRAPKSASCFIRYTALST